jgi:hypothetical protein
MSPLRKTALAAGILYLLTFVSIPTLVLYDQVRHNPSYILGPGPDTAVLVGGILEIVVALAGVGTAVALYPVLKRQNEGMALGFVGSRVLEGAGILAGVACLLVIVSLRQAGVGAEALIAGQTLALLYERIFLLSSSLMPALDDLLLGLLLLRSGLVPRALPLLGLVGVPLLLTGDVGTLLNFWAPVSPVSGLLALPVAVFELSLGIYLTVKGFKPAPIVSGDTRDAGVNASLTPAVAAR